MNYSMVEFGILAYMNRHGMSFHGIRVPSPSRGSNKGASWSGYMVDPRGGHGSRRQHARIDY